MRHIVLLFAGIVLCCGFAAKAQKAAPPKDAAQYVRISDPDHDFGKILYGKSVSYSLQINNISKDTLRLTNVEPSCGCTVPQWKLGPYAPGDTFSIKIAFNGYIMGQFQKTLTLLFNRDIVKIVRFHGDGVQELPVKAGDSESSSSDVGDMLFARK